MNNIIFIVLFLIIIIGAFILSRLKMIKATRAIVAIFYQKNAFTENRAIMPEELRINSRGFLSGIFHSRDYLPYAIQYLKKADIIQVTADGRLFLLKKKLTASGIDNLV
jgi:Na+/H+ antiporter NhaC